MWERCLMLQVVDDKTCWNPWSFIIDKGYSIKTFLLVEGRLCIHKKLSNRVRSLTDRTTVRNWIIAMQIFYLISVNLSLSTNWKLWPLSILRTCDKSSGVLQLCTFYSLIRSMTFVRYSTSYTPSCNLRIAWVYRHLLYV